MTPNPATTVRLSESELDEIRTLIEQRSAILFDASRERFFSTRLLDFIEEKHLASGTDLLRHIKSSSIEYESLLEQLLTQETSFFRYPAVYEALEKRIVPEIEERKFWETHDSTDYVNWSKAERVRFPNLKPSTTAISIRLPLGLLEQIKIAANKRDVPYQSLIKMWLAEKVG